MAIHGTNGPDTLIGGNGNNTIYGYGGNDRINGKEGNDELRGGDGRDEVHGGQGNDLVKGGRGNDLLFGGRDNDTLYGGQEDDTLQSGAANFPGYDQGGIDRWYGESGRDLFDISHGFSFNGTADYAHLKDFNSYDDTIDIGNYGNIQLTQSGSTVSIYTDRELLAKVDGTSNSTIKSELKLQDPKANDDSLSVSEGSSTSVDVLNNDSDPDTDKQYLFISGVKENIPGTVSVSGSNVIFSTNGEYNYLSSGESTTKTVYYTVDDGAGGDDPAAVAVTIHGVNDAPNADNDSITTNEDTSVSIHVLNNDKDVDRLDNLSVHSVNENIPGYVRNEGNKITYHPNNELDYLAAGQSANLTFSYTVTDGKGGFDPANVNLTVLGVNDSPTFNNLIASQDALAGEAYSFTIPANTFSDRDSGDSLTYTATLADGSSLPDWLSFNSHTGEFSGTPGNQDVGTNQVQVTATDRAGATVPSNLFNLIVEDGNEPPVIETNSFEIAENQTQVGKIQATDPESDSLTYSVSGGADASLLEINSHTGELSFKQEPDFENPQDRDANNVYQVEVIANDGVLDSTAQTVLITVTDQAEIKGSISGYKWNDANLNGFRDSEIIAGQTPDVVFVVDVSGSTRDSFVGNVSVGDVNGDGDSDTILDAELAGFMALNEELINLGLGDKARVEIVVFGTNAASYEQTASGLTPNTDADNNGISDIEDILSTITVGALGVGKYTNFEAALQTTETIFDNWNTSDGEGNLVFLSDGNPTAGGVYDDEVSRLNGKNFNLSAFGAGAGSSLPPLQKIDPNAQIFNNPDELLAVFGGISNGTEDSIVYLESKLSGVEIYLDLNNNGILDNGEPVTTTSDDNPNTPNLDETGNYQFENLSAGTYIVREVIPEGYVQTTPQSGFYEVVIHSDEPVTGINFGNGIEVTENDTLIGSAGNDLLDGKNGDDLLNGKNGHDTLKGGPGNDTLNGGKGKDVLTGDEGSDFLQGNGGNDNLNGGEGNDTLKGSGGKDNLSGEEGNDNLNGGGGNDTLIGGSGKDTLIGAGGSDFLQGDADNDKLNGGGGNDTLIGGSGKDTLIGGAGNDTFLFNSLGEGVDKIVDFWKGEDLIEVDSNAFAGGTFNYNHGNGKLFFDDGVVNQQIAILAGAPEFDVNSDIVLI